MFRSPASRWSSCTGSRPITSMRFSTRLAAKTVPERLALCKIEDWDHITAQMHFGAGYPAIPVWNEVPFFRGQKKIVLRNCGLINPDDVEEYIAIGGYQSLYKVLIDGTPELVNEQLKISRLRGRGGAGFSTGLKWEFLRKAAGGSQVPDLQRRRRRPRRLYKSQRTRRRSPFADRGHGDRRLHHRRQARHHLCSRRISARRPPAESGARASQRLRRPRRRHPRARLQVRHRPGRGRRRLCLRRRNGADQFARRPLRPAAAAPALPGRKGPVGLSDRHQQRRNLVQRRPHRRQGAGLVHRDRQQRQRRHQGLFAGRQSEEHRPGRNAVRHAAVELRLRRRFRQHARPPGQGGADRRSVRRLHPARIVRHARRLRIARQARLDHGLGRHGGDGRRQLHGRRRPLLHRIHPLRIVRQMHAVPGRSRQGAAHADAHHQGRRPRGRPHRAERTRADDSRHVAMRARPNRAEFDPHHAAPFPRRIRGPHQGQALPRRRLSGPGVVAVREQLSAAHEHPALPPALQGGPARGRVRIGHHGQSAAGFDGPRLSASVRRSLPPSDRRRGGQHARSPSRDRRLGAAVGSVRRDGRPHRRQASRADRPHGRRGGRRADRPHRRLLSRAVGSRRHHLRLPRRSRRHAALRPAGISAAQGDPRSRDRDHPPPRRPLRLQHAGRRRHSRSTISTPSSTRCSCRSAPGRKAGSISPAPN